MARHKEFVPETVADKAIEVFMTTGYEATTIRDLVAATNLKPGSLYNAYGDKAGFFNAVLDRYDETSPVHRVIALAETGAPRETIEALLNGVAGGKSRKGCLITNTAAELAGRDRNIARRIEASLMRLEDALCRLLERGQENGEFGVRNTPRDMARFLVTTLQGIQLLSKVKTDRDALAGAVNVALAALD